MRASFLALKNLYRPLLRQSLRPDHNKLGFRFDSCLGQLRIGHTEVVGAHVRSLARVAVVASSRSTTKYAPPAQEKRRAPSKECMPC